MNLPLRRPTLLTAWALALLLAPVAGFSQSGGTGGGGTSNEIRPPFNLRWAETSDRLEKLVVEAGGKVVARRPARGGREAIEVTGLPQSGLKKTIFYFKLGSLTAVELQYQEEDWLEEKYNTLMAEMRTRISERYGEGQQIARRTEKVGVNGVTQTVTGYKWVAGAANVQLIYFAATDSKNAYRTVSVHYNAF